MPKFGNKHTVFGYFWAKILKNYCHNCYPHPQICLIAKFCEKTKMPKFGTKNVLFGYFWTRILKQYCHICNQYLQQRCLNFQPKIPDFGIFELEFEKYIFILEINTLQFV